MSEATHMELRTRRSALGDISVNVAAGTKATTKVGPEKRVTRSSLSKDPSVDVVVEPGKDDDKPAGGRVSKRQRTSKEQKGEHVDDKLETSTSSSGGALTKRSSFDDKGNSKHDGKSEKLRLSDVDVNVTSKDQLENKQVLSASKISAASAEFRPRKIRRTLPLHMKSHDPAQCLDIIDDMYEIYFDMEEKYSPKSYMPSQKDINAKMRSILVDWLVEVHYKFKLQPQTLWLCINILDRYLEVAQTSRAKLQLVGVTSLLIACKFEEIYPPEVRDCVYITDYAYEREEVLKMETTILTQLNYEISVPTGYHFLTRFLNCIQASERTRHLASYYAERNLQEIDMLSAKPHVFASAAIYAALKQQSCQYRQLKTNPVWTTVLQEESGLSEADVVGCARAIVKHVSEEPETASKRKLVAAKKKYSAPKYENASGLPLPTI